MIRTTLATLALIAAAGVAHAQMQAPSTPEGRDQPVDARLPPATPTPRQPKSPMNPSAAEAAAKAALEKKGYTGVKSLTRDHGRQLGGQGDAQQRRDRRDPRAERHR